MPKRGQRGLAVACSPSPGGVRRGFRAAGPKGLPCEQCRVLQGPLPGRDEDLKVLKESGF